MVARDRVITAVGTAMEGQLDAEFREAEEEFINDESDSESMEDDPVPGSSVAAAALAQPRPVDVEISAYLARGCGCKKNDGRPCSTAVSCEE